MKENTYAINCAFKSYDKIKSVVPSKIGKIKGQYRFKEKYLSHIQWIG